MIKKHGKNIFTFFMCALCLTVLASPVKAQEDTGSKLVTIDLGEFLTLEDKDYVIKIAPEYPEYPMPEGTENGVYTMIITGANTESFPKIDYDSIGTYNYSISQQVETEDFDERDLQTYLLQVQVTRSETGELQASLIIRLIDEVAKLDSVVFKNTPADPKPIVDPPKPPQKAPVTGDDTIIWPYIVMLVSGLGLLFVVANDSRKKATK